MTTILLVEDDPLYAEQQQRMLANAGYDVQWAQDPQTAMERLDEHKIDAVVLDLLLAYNTAFSLLNELQSHVETARLPVVIYSSQADMLQTTSLADYGVVQVLDKAQMRPTDTAKVLQKAGV